MTALWDLFLNWLADRLIDLATAAWPVLYRIYTGEET